MRYVIAITGVLAFALTIATNRKAKSPSPAIATVIAYSLAIFLDTWYALRLPLPSVGRWVIWFSNPMADAVGKWLK
ncbi:hypothetical protein [Cohnella yongneupensis]|uniref:Holin n=1 Tax=Cohnella yongneupensis TaxID=425006 RepID=A0ABW0R432_9BACL